MVAEELMARVGFDFERDRVVLSKPDVNVHSGILKKYGADKYLDTHELIRLAFQQERED
jgi:hypothetical protein